MSKKIPFTKMHGLGNDFVVLDETQQTYGLGAEQYRWIADRRFGVGADQILTVRPSGQADVDFAYIIHNADGGEVEQCGNGARCFARYVFDKGLTDKKAIRVQTQKGIIEPELLDDGMVRVDMGVPVFSHADVPFDPQYASKEDASKEYASTAHVGVQSAEWEQWTLVENGDASQHGQCQFVAVVSMGNPHAVQVVEDVDAAPVEAVGAWVESHPAFPQRVNAGFMQIISRTEVKLRVFERGSGETLACGTGACAAVVAGVRLGLLDAGADVLVHARGGDMRIAWAGVGASVMMTGPAVTVFEGELVLP